MFRTNFFVFCTFRRQKIVFDVSYTSDLEFLFSIKKKNHSRHFICDITQNINNIRNNIHIISIFGSLRFVIVYIFTINRESFLFVQKLHFFIILFTNTHTHTQTTKRCDALEQNLIALYREKPA